MALNPPESMDITDSREHSPTRSVLATEEPIIEPSFSNESYLTMKLPGKDSIKNLRAQKAAENAHEKAKRLSRHLSRHSAQVSMINSPSRFRSSPSGPSTETPIDFDNIPLQKLRRRKHYSIEDGTDEDEEETDEYEDEDEVEADERDRPVSSNWLTPLINAAKHSLGRRKAQEASRDFQRELRRVKARESPSSSGQVTPIYQRNLDSYIPRTREGLLSARLHSAHSPLSTGASTPATTPEREEPSPSRPKLLSRSTGALDVLFGMRKKKIDQESLQIKVHVAEMLIRQRFLVKMCEALMTYGAPTHRLEEYMRMASRVLEIQSQYFYLPSCMLIAFDDKLTHRTDVKIVRAPPGVDLSKLKETHDIYKDVLHDQLDLEEAISLLDKVIRSEPRYGRWFVIFMYGLASASVGPFAFKAYWADLPIAFMLGLFVGWFQLIIVPRSDMYSNVSEVSIAVVTSFLARAFGSIRHGQYFCFSAIAQSSIVLILPGYTLLCGSLELQSRNFVAGSVRIVFVLIYSLLLGFGTLVGTALYGMIDHSAISDTSCAPSMNEYLTWIFIPVFSGCLVVINQGRTKQIEIMIAIAFVGYIVNHYASIASGNLQVAQAIGALAVGILANLYSRILGGTAVAAVLPAVFVQVPSGLAAGASLISGVVSADEMTGKGGNSAVTKGETLGTARVGTDGMVAMVIYGMTQIAVGITVGLFFSSVIVYPRGKRRSGLFSF